MKGVKVELIRISSWEGIKRPLPTALPRWSSTAATRRHVIACAAGADVGQAQLKRARLYLESEQFEEAVRDFDAAAYYHVLRAQFQGLGVPIADAKL